MFAGICKRLVSATQAVTFDNFCQDTARRTKIDTFRPKLTQTILA